MNETEETLEQIPEKGELLKAIENLSNKVDNLNNKFDKMEKSTNAQFEAIREGIVYNNARFARLEAIALEGKSIALTVRSQMTILTEEIHQMRKEPVMWCADNPQA